MPAKLQRQQSSEDRGNLRAVGDTACWVAFLVVIGIHLVLFKHLPIPQVMSFLQRRVTITDCQLVVMMAEDLNLLRWTLLMPIGERLGAMI
jgi:hypothetical protein